jgi:NitT/TauT family transport system ATP-binding protein
MLLMDEPFAALDALTREQLYGDLQRIWKARNKTIVFVTHNVREAACLGDRVIVFSPRPGRIREEFAVKLASAARHQQCRPCRSRHGNYESAEEL